MESADRKSAGSASSLTGVNRFAYVDVVRGVAALAVVLQHLLEKVSPGFRTFSEQTFNLGTFGVTAFLLVSGFIIPISLERGGSNRKFWIGRFFRLYPLYWFSLILAGVLATGGLALGEGFDPASTTHWAANATMLQQFFGQPHAVGLYWTLTIEMALYIGCSILFAMGALRKSVRIASIGLGLAFLLAVAVPLVLDRRVPGGYLFFLLTTLVGGVVYRWSQGDASSRQLNGILAATGTFGFATAWVNFGLHPTEHETALRMVLSWAAAFGFFFGMYHLRTRPMPNFAKWLGKVSYSVYLLHPAVMAFTPSSLPTTGYVVVALAGTLAASAFTYRFVEDPMIRLGRRLQDSLGRARFEGTPAAVREAV